MAKGSVSLKMRRKKSQARKKCRDYHGSSARQKAAWSGEMRGEEKRQANRGAGPRLSRQSHKFRPRDVVPPPDTRQSQHFWGNSGARSARNGW